jgi:hypothetical protein
MKTRICRLEFSVTCLADIRVLYHAWNRLWALEVEVPLVYVMIEDRLPGEKVCLNFQANPEMLTRFLTILEQRGLKFKCDEIVPGLLTTCRIDQDRGGLTVIGGSGADEPGSGPDS